MLGVVPSVSTSEIGFESGCIWILGEVGKGSRKRGSLPLGKGNGELSPRVPHPLPPRQLLQHNVTRHGRTEEGEKKCLCVYAHDLDISKDFTPHFT